MLPRTLRASSVLAAAAALIVSCGDDDPGPTSQDAGRDSQVPVGQIDAGNTQIDAAVTPLDATTTPDTSVAEQPSQFSLRFAYTAGERVLHCGDVLTGQGLDGKNTVDINDLRFFVHDLKFLDKEGKDVALTLDTNDFQLHHAAGTVSLVDLTSNEVGGCTTDAFPNSEGTKRVNDVITGTTLISKVASVRFTVGVSQAVMKKAILENSAEGQPSPLGDLQWPWAVGWRHFALNFALKNAAGEQGVGFIHLGSRDCAAALTDLALTDRDTCTYVNNPDVAFDNFSLTQDLIAVDIPTLVKGLDFVSDLYDAQGNVTGQGAGVGCHSFPDAPDCQLVFPAFGLSFDNGKADASQNSVFKAKRQ